MVMLNSGLSARYNLGPVQPWVEAAAYFIGPRHNIKTIGGWRPSDPFPDHPSGHALDFMITSQAQGDQVAADVIANAQALGVSYLIWNHRTWSPQQGWQPYTSTDNPHTDHVHVTFWNPGTGVPGADNPVGLTGGNDATLVSKVDNTCAMKITIPLKGETCLLSKGAVRSLLGLVLLSGAVVVGLVGVIVLVTYGLKSQPVADTLRSVPLAGSLANRIPR